MKHTQEWKIKMSRRNSGENNPFFGRKHSLETRNKMKQNNAKFWLDKKRPNLHSEKTREIMSEKRKGKNLGNIFGFKKGQLSWNTGQNSRPNCLECNKKLSDYRGKLCIKCFRSKHHPNYIEDRSQLKKHNRRNDMSYKEWSRNVKIRDGWKCKISDENCNGRIEAHHILSWKDYLELRYDINNGISLCHFHHPRKRIDEINLSPYFKSLVAQKD